LGHSIILIFVGDGGKGEGKRGVTEEQENEERGASICRYRGSREVCQRKSGDDEKEKSRRPSLENDAQRADDSEHRFLYAAEGRGARRAAAEKLRTRQKGTRRLKRSRSV